MSTTVNPLDIFDAEAALLKNFLAELPLDAWEEPTPAPGWKVRDQVGHLAFVYSIAGKAAASPDEFHSIMETTRKVGFDNAINAALTEDAAGSPEEVLARLVKMAAYASESIRQVPSDAMIPWLVRELPPATLALAGTMELFAHGQDIADALGHQLPRTDRLAPLVNFIHVTIPFGYESNQLPMPEGTFRFETTLPSGRDYTVGPDDAENVVRGPAIELALVATRRRHHADTNLTAEGPDAATWLTIAQAYRGKSGAGRAPGQFRSTTAVPQ